jgi:hypothetical protein
MTKRRIYNLLAICFVVLFASIVNPMPAQAAFNKTTAKKNVTVTYKKLSKGVLAIYKNKNKSTISLTAKMVFKDGGDKTLSSEKQTNLCLAGKSTAAFYFQAPKDSYGNTLNYSGYKGSFSVAKSKYTSYSKKISVDSTLEVIEGKFAAVNLSKKTLSNIHATIVFYDSNSNIVACTTKSLNCFNKNAIDQFSISYAGESYQPSKVKVYIDWAY